LAKPVSDLAKPVSDLAKPVSDKFRVFGSDYPTLDGTAERDYIHVSDLARAHVCALDRMRPGYHVYNVGLGRPVSVLEMIGAFERVNAVKLDYEMAPRRSGDLPTYYARIDKIKAELEWEPRYGLDDLVRVPAASQTPSS